MFINTNYKMKCMIRRTKSIEITAEIVHWVMEDCGNYFKPGMNIGSVQLEAHRPEITKSDVKEKMLKQVGCLNRYCYIGKILAMEVSDDMETKRTIVSSVVVDCGVPIRFNYGAEYVIDYSFPKNVKPGTWVIGQCDIFFLTCVDGSNTRLPVEATVAKVYKLVKEPNENFGKVIEIEDSGNAFKLGSNDIFVTLKLGKAGKLWDDTKGRNLKLLK